MEEGIYSTWLQSWATGVDGQTIVNPVTGVTTTAQIGSPSLECSNDSYSMNESEIHCPGSTCTPGWDGAVAQSLDSDTAIEGMFTNGPSTGALLYMYGAAVWLYDDIPPAVSVSGSGYDPTGPITTPTNLSMTTTASTSAAS